MGRLHQMSGVVLSLLAISAMIFTCVYHTKLTVPTHVMFQNKSHRFYANSAEPQLKRIILFATVSEHNFTQLGNLVDKKKQSTGKTQYQRIGLNYSTKWKDHNKTIKQTVFSKQNLYRRPKHVQRRNETSASIIAHVRDTHQTIETNTSLNLPRTRTSEHIIGQKYRPEKLVTTTEAWVNQTEQEAVIQRFLFSQNLGRFGNTMFIYASCYSIALKNNLTLFMSKTDKIYQPFVNIPRLPAPDTKQCKRKLVTFKQKRPRYFERFNLSKTNVSCVRIEGFLQSWRYFEDYFDDIRNQFTWKTSVKEKALQTIEKLKKQTLPHLASLNITTVGIHVRRGDYVKSKRPMADREYFESAKDYFMKNFSNVLFIVTTSPNQKDRMWCEDNIQNGSGLTVIASSRDRFVDMALLSLTDHVIISTGTFGWWAGFLNKGRVLHFDWIPVNHSRYNRDDYILPHWIGIKAVNTDTNNTSVFRTVPSS